MSHAQSYTAAAIGIAIFYLWSFSIVLSVRLQALRQRSVVWATFFSVFLGPLAALYFFCLQKKEASLGEQRLPVIHLKAVLYGLCIILAGALGGLGIAFAFHASSESLQLYLLIGTLSASLAAGMLMAYIGQRLAVIESFLVLTIVAFLPIIFSEKILQLFTYGTATAYFATILLAIGAFTLLLLILGGVLGFLFSGEGHFSFNFSFEKYIGFRFLMAKRTSHAVSLITIISVFAVIVGCAGMVVVMSVMDGFSSDLRRKILGTNAHLVVMKYGDSFRDYASIIKRTAKLPGIIGASPYILNEVMISSEANISGAVIKGIEVSTVGQVSSLPANITEGSLVHLEKPQFIPQRKVGERKKELEAIEELFSQAPAKTKNIDLLPGIVIGVEMAKFLRVTVGSPLTVISPVSEMGPTGPIPKAKNFRVAGIFFSGMYEYDAKFVYISLKEANHFFVMKGSASGIEYKVRDFEQTQSVSHEIKQELGGYPYYTRDWMQMNRNLFSALKLEKIAMFIILIALVFMASLLILVALVMVVMEKGKEIAILKSIGVTDLSIMKIFVTYGLSIGASGAVLGVSLGLIFCWLLSLFGIGLDPEVYYISELPVKIDLFDVVVVALSAIIISFLATIPPSLFAAKLRPVEGLRYE